MIIMIIENVLRIDNIIMKASRLYVDFPPCRFYNKQKNLYLFLKNCIGFKNLSAVKEKSKIFPCKFFNLH